MSSTVGFIGKHELRIDEKGRITIPARFKAVLLDKYPQDQMQVVVTLSLDQNLAVLPVSEYTRMAERFMQYDDLDEATRRVQEMVTVMASEERVDSSGRILLPAGLREVAQIDREVTCNGRIHSFEIWDRARWNRAQGEMLQNREKLIEQVRLKNRAG